MEEKGGSWGPGRREGGSRWRGTGPGTTRPGLQFHREPAAPGVPSASFLACPHPARLPTGDPAVSCRRGQGPRRPPYRRVLIPKKVFSLGSRQQLPGTAAGVLRQELEHAVSPGSTGGGALGASRRRPAQLGSRAHARIGGLWEAPGRAPPAAGSPRGFWKFLFDLSSELDPGETLNALEHWLTSDCSF